MKSQAFAVWDFTRLHEKLILSSSSFGLIRVVTYVDELVGFAFLMSPLKIVAKHQPIRDDRGLACYSIAIGIFNN